LTPNPIRTVLSSIQKHQVQGLLMGGQACVLYGAAEFSRDTALREEEDREREADRAYWAPLKQELERLRRRTRDQGS
jgi:hypothetical protein